MPRPEARRAAPFATAGSPPACRELWHTCSLLMHGLANGLEALEVSVRICVDVLWPRRKCQVGLEDCAHVAASLVTLLCRALVAVISLLRLCLLC